MFSEFIFCDDAKLNEIEENIWIARNIRHAMEIGELFLVYQPIVDINTRAILGAPGVVPLGVCGAGDHFTAEVHYHC
ncbi:hypothetical protein GCM10029976_004350 [Kribbella albertanoniae]